MRALVERGRFITDRTLTKYIAMLPKSFGEELLGLGPRQHWVDMGAGLALSQAAYGARNPAPRYPQHQPKVALEVVERLSHVPLARRATTTAITYRDFDKRHWWGPTYLTEKPERPPKMLTRRFEDVSNDEVGRADLITDVFGIFAYAEQPDVVLRRYLALLEDTGSIYIYLGRMDYARRSPVTLASGEKVDLADWLVRQRGLDVEILDGLEEGRNLKAIARLRKTPGEVPHVARLVLEGTIELTSPPHRRYRERAPAPVPALQA